MASRLITVSQLKCACLSPEWRERWLRGERPPTLIFPRSPAVPVQGTLFHQLADQFAEWLTAAGKKRRAALADADALWAQMYEEIARVKLDELIAAGKLPSAHHLSQALRAFCGRLVEIRARTIGFRNWQDVFLTREFQLDAVRFESASCELLVSGRPDAVRSHPADGLEVVDYKLSRGDNLKHDLLQLAIYTRLLRETKPGLTFSGVLEFYEPALHLVSVSVPELEGIFQDAVQPVIDEINGIPESSTYQRAEPTTTFGKPEPQAIDAFGALIKRTYADFKLSVSVLGRQEAPQLIRYRVQPAGGVRVASLANRAADLQVALRLKQPPLIQAAPGCVTIDIPKDQPDSVL